MEMAAGNATDSFLNKNGLLNLNSYKEVDVSWLNLSVRLILIKYG